MDRNLPENSYQILIQETPMSRGLLRPGYVFSREDAENLEMLGIQVEQADGFLRVRRAPRSGGDGRPGLTRPRRPP